MGYNALIEKSLTRAFNLLKDLAVESVFVKKTVSDFDFGTGSASTTSQNTIVKIIDIDTSKDTKTGNVTKQFMLRVADVGDLGSYDVITYKGSNWRIGSIIKSNGYIFIVEAFKG